MSDPLLDEHLARWGVAKYPAEPAAAAALRRTHVLVFDPHVCVIHHAHQSSGGAQWEQTDSLSLSLKAVSTACVSRARRTPHAARFKQPYRIRPISVQVQYVCLSWQLPVRAAGHPRGAADRR